MNMTLLVIMSIAFIVGGLAFCGISVYLSLSKQSDSNFTRIAGKIFMVMGAVTLVSGILGLSFRKELTRNAVALFATIYLAIVTALSAVFTAMLNKNKLTTPAETDNNNCDQKEDI